MLINCVAYKDGPSSATFRSTTSATTSPSPAASSGSRSRTPTPEELAKMQEEFGLHDLAIEDARHGHQRPKIEEYGDIPVRRAAHGGDRPTDDLAIGEVDIFVGTNYVLSVRNRTQQGFLGVRARCEREPQLLKHGPAFVFYALMDAVVDRYFPDHRRPRDRPRGVEEQIFQPRLGRANIEQLYALKRGSASSSTPWRRCRRPWPS